MLVTFDCPEHLVETLIDFAETLGIRSSKLVPSIPGLNEAERIVLGALDIGELGQLGSYDVLDFWRAFTRSLSSDVKIVDVGRTMKHHGIRFRDAEPDIFLGKALAEGCGLNAQICSVLRRAHVPTVAFLRLLPMEDIVQIPKLGGAALDSIEAFKASDDSTE